MFVVGVFMIEKSAISKKCIENILTKCWCLRFSSVELYKLFELISWLNIALSGKQFVSGFDLFSHLTSCSQYNVNHSDLVCFFLTAKHNYASIDDHNWIKLIRYHIRYFRFWVFRFTVLSQMKKKTSRKISKRRQI